MNTSAIRDAEMFPSIRQDQDRFWKVVARLALVCLCFDLACSSSSKMGPDTFVAGDPAGSVNARTGGATNLGTAGIGGTAGAPAPSGFAGTGGTAGATRASGSGGMGIAGALGTGGVGGTRGAAGASGAGGSGGAIGYNPCPQSGGPCKILPLGDSITFGIQLAGAYRIELFRQAVTANQNITFVGSQKNGPAMVAGVAFPPNHEGYSGYTIAQIDQPILPPALKLNPDIITLMIGTNDIYGQDPTNAPQRLGHLLDDIFSMSPHALVVVAQLTPLSCCMSTVTTFNQALPGLVQMRAAAGKHVIMVDMSGTEISSDSVHPDEAGYTHMGQVWYAAISGLLPKK